MRERNADFHDCDDSHDFYLIRLNLDDLENLRSVLRFNFQLIKGSPFYLSDISHYR
jgi:hypothetical protein